AVLENHKNYDFKPYVLKTADRGKSWTSIAGDLPEDHYVLAIAEDHVNPNLLFVGTEFGLFFTVDGGKKWVRLRGGLPTIAVRDLAIQKRENDLVAATFGRGFYILDDYSPLRAVSKEALDKDAAVFAVKNTPIYVPSSPYGGRGSGFQGASHYLAANPAFGATITYYLKEPIRTQREQRREKEREAERKKEDLPFPNFEELRAEAQEERPAVVITVRDSSGAVVREITGPVGRGMHRVNWDLRHNPPVVPAARRPEGDEEQSGGGGGFGGGPQGPMVVPGDFTVSVAKRVNGEETAIGQPQKFTVYVLGSSPLAAKDWPALGAFQRQVADLQRAALGTSRYVAFLNERVSTIERAFGVTANAPASLRKDAKTIDERLEKIQTALNGDRFLTRMQEATAPGIMQRIQFAVINTTSDPTGAQRDQYRIAAELFQQTHAEVKTVAAELQKLEDAMEKAGAPGLPGRLPEWKP
ncbi:MAG: glycosyl hydrolase, partial [Candidatus Acidiferrales bacterium]